MKKYKITFKDRFVKAKSKRALEEELDELIAACDEMDVPYPTIIKIEEVK